MPSNDSLDQNTDSINLVQILRDLAKEKKRFLINGLKVLAVWAVLFIAYALLTFNSSTYYSIGLGLNFPQAAQGKYPNGSAFSPSDIVSNTVLEKVWSENKLADRGITLQSFQRSLSAIPYTGEINFIDTKYKGLLAQKNLSRTDIEKIEADYKAEVAQASSKNIKLVLDSGKNSYDLGLASKVLNDIATTWSQTAIEKLGVSRSPVLDGLALNDQMKSESPYIVINYLNDVVYRAHAIITTMLGDVNSNSYRDEKSGFNLMGLNARLDEIANYQIDQLDAFVAINTKLTDLERLQSEYKVKELQEQRKLLLLKAESNRQALIDYTRLRNQSNTSAPGQISSKGGSDITGVQINGDAISRLVSLAEESKDAVYRQRLTDERISLENQANDLNTRISKLERRINFTPNKAIGLTPESKKEYGALLDRTWGDLSGVINAITRIQVMAQKDFVGDSGLLYTLVSQPESYSPGRSALKKAGLISIFAALFLSVLFTLGQLFAGKVFSKSEA